MIYEAIHAALPPLVRLTWRPRVLGLDNVRNYVGSWTEWGNKVGAPIEKS